MRRLKKGFTLTEVLLAMAVIGVISALVMPQLVKSTQKDKAGIVLGKAVEQIELGCQNMMQEYNSRDDAGVSMVDTLNAMDGNYTFSMDRLAPYIGATRVTNQAGGNRFGQRYRFNKFPAEIITSGLAMFQPNVPERERIVEPSIVIDVNGADSRPNMAGRDRFTFDLRNDGKLVPFGLNSNACDGDNPTINANCTARVVKDGFKIRYNW